MTFNDALWRVIDWCGWAWWLPFVAYAVYGLNKMYRLAPAETAIGRWIRVLFTMGFLCLFFVPIFNGLGPVGFHLLAIGLCLWLRQTHAACIKAGKIKPSTKNTLVGRLADRMMAKQ